MESWRALFWVAVGGSAGAVSRHAIGLLSKQWIAPDFPVGTLCANLLGCFLMGLLLGSSVGEKHPVAKLAIGTGFLGSLTTFSTFSAETMAQLNQQQYLVAAGYAVVSVIGGILLTLLGMSLSGAFRAQG